MHLPLFQKYSEMKVVPMETLFEPDWRDAKKLKICPICHRNLYLMKNNKYWYCRSKVNKHKFLIGVDKMK